MEEQTQQTQQTQQEQQIQPTAEEATTIGMFLKYTRLKQKKSVEAVSEALCIRKIYIKALEEDDYETLPPVPYGVGFVRSYATYLGLNAQRIAQIYKQQAFPQKEKNSQTVVKEHTELTTPKKKQIYIGIAAMVLLYFMWLGVRFITSPGQPAYVPNTTDIEVIDVMPVAEEPDEEVVIIEEKPVQETQEVLNTEPQVKTLEESYKPEPQPIEPKKTIIELKFKGPSWVELKDAQKVFVSGIKDKGFNFKADYTEGMILSIGKYYNVDVYIDGVLTKVASPRKQTNIQLEQFIKH